MSRISTVRGNFRLYDFQHRRFVGPLETRKEAEKRKSSQARGKRDALTNYFRTRVHPVSVEPDGKAITQAHQESIAAWWGDRV